jgi:multiple sugar transport system ATP-binding protein
MEARQIGPFGPAYEEYKDAAMLLGIRPEAIGAASSDTADGTTFEARINVVEPTGADNLAFLTLGQSEVIARLPPGRIAVGQRIRLQIDPARALIFDPRLERLIG